MTWRRVTAGFAEEFFAQFQADSADAGRQLAAAGGECELVEETDQHISAVGHDRRPADRALGLLATGPAANGFGGPGDEVVVGSPLAELCLRYHGQSSPPVAGVRSAER
ncbi:hypothetical protein [Saccharopolyspora hattusasensis]|uniref:hypothetical protein n=1 Tax=Saccharopolyspora hattusasensis TaxID=1128679 RepID=UPI003D98A511